MTHSDFDSSTASSKAQITEAHIHKLFSNIGVDTEKTSAVIDLYSKNKQDLRALLNLQDSQGASIMMKAIQQNDGYVVTAMLARGANLNEPYLPGQTETVYDYAKKYATYNGREPIALNAIESFLSAKEQCPVNLMNTAELMQLQTPDYTKDTIRIYHGARSNNSCEDLTFYLENVVPTGIKEKSPTLAAFPVGQFFKPGSIGFSYDIPKELIAFDGEKNDKAVISLDTQTGVARILNQEKILPFKDFKSEVIYRPEVYSKKSYNPYSQQESDFTVTTGQLDDKQIAILSQMQTRLNQDYQANVNSHSNTNANSVHIAGNAQQVINKMASLREQFFNTNTSGLKEKPTI
jgi:hypothetical protein